VYAYVAVDFWGSVWYQEQALEKGRLN